MIMINTFLTVVIVIMTAMMGIFTIRVRRICNSLYDSQRADFHVLQNLCNRPDRFEASENKIYAVKKLNDAGMLWNLIMIIPEDPNYPEYANSVASEITETLNNELNPC